MQKLLRALGETMFVTDEVYQKETLYDVLSTMCPDEILGYYDDWKKDHHTRGDIVRLNTGSIALLTKRVSKTGLNGFLLEDEGYEPGTWDYIPDGAIVETIVHVDLDRWGDNEY